ncbi:MAG: translation initiation factor IF-5A [Candidatus ainarchaeum sp.]|nr:translation initiation factor IF-5A [Candidatus ainarchaeum sp.]
MVEKTFCSAKELKEGRYLLIDGIPCRIVEIESSKPGKHGSAKMRITGIGVFDSQKKICLSPSDADVEVPVIERRTVQILSMSGNIASVMDSQTYETYDIDVPEEHLKNAEAGKEAEILVCMGRKKFERVR